MPCAPSGTSGSPSSGSRPVTSTSIAWSMPGTRTSAWSPSTSRGPRRCSSPGVGRGMGFRDSNQDLLGFVHLVPERARARILDIAATQLPDGGAYHQYQPLTKRGNDAVGSGFNDDPAWLVLAVAAYVKETGDVGILDEPVPFDNAPGSEAPLYEHLRRSIGYTLDRLGPHGLPLIGRADWNDCLNLNTFSDTPGESFQTHANRSGGVAESVFIAGLFVLAARELAAIAARRGDEAEAARCRRRRGAMIGAVDAHGWDGAWFRRAYDYFGRPVGSAEQRRGPDLPRAPGDLHHGRHRARRRPGGHRARVGPRAARHAARDPAAPARLHALPARARRDHLVPARVQGERERVLPHEPVADDRRGDGRRRRRGARGLPADQPHRPRGDLGRSTAASRTSTPRRSPDATPRRMARRRTPGSPGRPPGTSSRSASGSSASAPSTTACGWSPSSRAPGRASARRACSAARRTRSTCAATRRWAGGGPALVVDGGRSRAPRSRCRRRAPPRSPSRCGCHERRRAGSHPARPGRLPRATDAPPREPLAGGGGARGRRARGSSAWPRPARDENLLAETPDEGWDTPYGRYELLGGHRLWFAPEDSDRVAVPEGDGLVVEPLDDGVRLVGAVEPGTGLVRSIAIRLDAAVADVHGPPRAAERGRGSRSRSRPGRSRSCRSAGGVLLPQRRAVSGHRVRPNRNLVLWPYTSWEDPRLRIHDGLVVVDAVAGDDLKLGFLDDAGWVAYERAGTALVRRFDPAVGEPHPDLGCNVETYCGRRYLELELLGPLQVLQPGDTAVLEERWEVRAAVRRQARPDGARCEPGPADRRGARGGPPDASARPLPRGLHLGGRDVRLPGGGSLGCRRQGRVDLGPLRAHAGQDRRRRDRRRRVRPVPPVPRGRRDPARPRPRCVPVQRLVAEGRPRAGRPGQPGGPGPLPAARRRAARRGHRARGPRSTTGTCRSGSRTAADGPSAR